MIKIYVLCISGNELIRFEENQVKKGNSYEVQTGFGVIFQDVSHKYFRFDSRNSHLIE